MCGIAGMVSVGRPLFDRAEEVARRMAVTLRHRGPDRQSAWAAPSTRCVFGHARLRVIDLETGDQPMPNEDGSVVVLLNGEIYNFAELRTQLQDRGHRFRSSSDTEVIVHGYEEWGLDVASHLDGMFAFAVWDESERRLLLGRDRVGKKPLFVYEDETVLAFSSELKGLLEVPELDLGLNPAAVPLYLTFGYVPSPETFYEKIKKLPPASCLVLEEDGSRRTWSYWDASFERRPVPYGEAKAETLRRVEAAVKRRLISDVPLGAFLSGGVDSTVVVAVMSELMAEPVRTFSIGFEGAPGYDETFFARVAAERLGTVHTEFKVGPQSVDLLDRLVGAYDEPFGDSSAIPTYLVSELAREHVTVALTGDGGDEIFCGYKRFRAMELANAVPAWVAAGAGSILGLFHDRSDVRSVRGQLTRFFGAARAPEAERWLRWVGLFTDDLDSALNAELRGQLREMDVAASIRAPMEDLAGSSVLARSLSANFRTYLLDDLLVKADRSSMAHGLELRSPFLDTALIEYATSLPDGHLRRGRVLKRVLKDAFADVVPGSILERGKMGFGVPIPDWLRGPWRPMLQERILSDDARIWQWLCRDYVLKRAELHFERRVDFSHQLWSLLTLETWLQQEGRARQGDVDSETDAIEARGRI